jgi:hypothetical protein
VLKLPNIHTRSGIFFVVSPHETLSTFMAIAGIVGVVSAFAAREARDGNILIAILDLTAGGVILAWPDLGLATLAVIIGIVLSARRLVHRRRLAASYARPRAGNRPRRPRRGLSLTQPSAADCLRPPGCARAGQGAQGWTAASGVVSLAG